MFTEVVIPLLGVKHTSLIGISTPLGSDNFYSSLLESKKPNGKPLFNVCTITLICEACRAKGLTDSCPHNNETPPWKTNERQELVKTLMANDKAMYQREQLGVVTSQGNSCLDRDSISEMNRPESFFRVVRGQAPREVFVVIDPCGGGMSCLAICTGCIVGATMVLFGADSEVVQNDDEQEALLNRHVKAVREHPLGMHARIVLVVERNFGGSVLASRICNVLRGYQPIYAMTQDAVGGGGGSKRAHGGAPKAPNPGVVTTAQVKERARVDLQRLLKGSLIRFCDTMVSARADIRDEVCKQLMNYKYEIRAGRDAFSKTRWVLTGKSGSSNDDLCICINLMAFWASTYFADSGVNVLPIAS